MLTDNDPRTTGEYIRRFPGEGDDSDVILTGVVHDHPASTYRVRSIIDAADPEVVALELAPVAVPLFERYATDDRTPSTSGGEMSAAIQAATTDRIVGIDGPTPAFLWRLVRNLRREDVAPSTIRSLLSGIVSVTKHAVACRIAATLDALTAIRLPVVSPVDHECDWSDDPRRQAADERDQIRRAESVLSIFGQSDAAHIRDVAREAHMAERLSTLRREGTVVAIVGVDHLDSVAELIA